MTADAAFFYGVFARSLPGFGAPTARRESVFASARFSAVRTPSPGRMRVFHLRITEFADVETIINYQGFFFARDAAGTLIVEGHAQHSLSSVAP